jgi:hypothetical protein
MTKLKAAISLALFGATLASSAPAYAWMECDRRFDSTCPVFWGEAWGGDYPSPALPECREGEREEAVLDENGFILYWTCV